MHVQKCKLSPEKLAQEGLRIPVALNSPGLSPDERHEAITGYMVLSTAEECTKVDHSAAVELALPDSGTKLAVTTPRGSIETRMFSVGIRFTEALDENERECSTVMQVAAVCDLPGGCLGVFGRDFLSRAKLAYDGMAGEASLAFPTADGHFIEMPLRPLKT